MRNLVRVAVIAASPLIALNLAVAFFGSSFVFPLSPYFLSNKLEALRLYAKHRSGCLFGPAHPNPAVVAREAEIQYGLPRGLMSAIVEVESGNRAHRISAAGAMGPAQLMSGTARDLKVADPFDVTSSIDGGARHIRNLLRRYRDITLAVAAYNAGPGNVTTSVPKNSETPYYVAKVMRRYQELATENGSRR